MELETTLANSSQCTFYEWSRDPQHAKFFRIFSIISVLTVLVVIVVLGNALVIAAVLLRRRLRSATGLLILSLGVADLLVGTVILPFSIANEVLSGYWIFGETWCTIWVTMDIWMCTASIYNLVAISIDRYVAIIKPLNYPMLVTKFRARCTVAVVWIGSFLICSPSFFLANTTNTGEGGSTCQCTPANASRTYIIFSASSSFYVPMAVVIFVYFRIYIAARAATKSIYSGMMQVTANANKNAKSYLLNHPNVLNKESMPMLRVHRGSGVNSIKPPHMTSRITNGPPPSTTITNQNAQPYTRNNSESMASVHKPVNRMNRSESERDEHDRNVEGDHASSESDSSQPLCQSTQPLSDCLKDINHDVHNEHEISKKQETHSRFMKNPLKNLIRRGQRKKAGCAYEKRLSLEIKAAKTVAIVTGCFIFCWLGFSLLYGLELKTDDVTWSILFWLGYLNSALNPVIYTVFNREFRTCFKRLLTCHHLNHPTTTKYTTNNSYNSTIRPNTTVKSYTYNTTPAHIAAPHSVPATASQ